MKKRIFNLLFIFTIGAIIFNLFLTNIINVSADWNWEDINKKEVSITCPKLAFEISNGKTGTMGVKIKNAKIKDAKVTSNNKKIATVKIEEKKYIKVTGKKEGNTKIKIKVGGKTKECSVKVNKKNTKTKEEIDAENIVNEGISYIKEEIDNIDSNNKTTQTSIKKIKTIKCPNKTIKVGQTGEIKYTINPKDASKDNLDIIVKGGSKDKIKITSKQPLKVKGLKEGTGTVVIKYNGKTASCKIKVEKATSSSSKKTTTKNTTKKTNNNSVTKVTIKGDSKINIGDTKTYTANVSPSNANRKVTWKSSNKKIAKVNSNGQVTGIKKGQVTITATSKDNVNKKDSIKIEVVKPTSKLGSSQKTDICSYDTMGIWNNNGTSILIGNTTYIPYINDENFEINNYEYISTDNSIIKIGEDGKITGIKSGYVYIKVLSKVDGSQYKSILYIKVLDPSMCDNKTIKSITINKKSSSIYISETANLKVTINPSDISNKNVIWKSSNDKVATVKNGKVTAKRKGKATITATSVLDPTKSVSAKITVLGEKEFSKTLTSSSFKRVITCSAYDGAYIAQSLAVTKSHYICALINSNDTKTVLQVWNKNTKKRANVITGNFGHANGMTYNSKNKNLYIAHMNSNKYSKISTKENSLLKKISSKTKKTKYDLSSIAYDKYNDNYYTAKGSKVHIYNSKFKHIKSFNKKISNTPQDIGSYKGLVLVIDYKETGKYKNYIYVYRASTGAYIGKYIISDIPGELESISYDYENKNFVLYFNDYGGVIYTTKNIKLDKYVQ